MEMMIGEYQIHKELGSGAYGKVYKAIHQESETIVALKEI